MVIPSIRSRAGHYDETGCVNDQGCSWEVNEATHSESLGGCYEEIHNLSGKFRKVGTLGKEHLRAAAARSNEALNQLGPDIQGLESEGTTERDVMAGDYDNFSRYMERRIKFGAMS